MGKAAKNGFNPKVFLAKVGTGKKISKYQRIKSFSPKAIGRTRSSTFKMAGSKSSSYPIRARKRLSELSDPISSSAKVVSTANQYASVPPRRWKNA
jgi:hypothetical protein